MRRCSRSARARTVAIGSGLIAWLVFGLVFGLGAWLVVWLVIWLGALLLKELSEELFDGWHGWLGVWLVAWLGVWLVAWLGGGLMVFGLGIWLGGGLLVFGLGAVSAAVIKHYLHRYLLYRQTSLPFRDLIPWLDHCVERLLLRRVGGGYIFTHRLLMEHFAAKYKEPAKE